MPSERNVSVVYCPADEIQLGAELAEDLGAVLRPVLELVTPEDQGPEALSGDALDGGPGWQVLHQALGAIADLHRGETVVVVTPSGEPGREIRIDADGWAVHGLS